MVGLKPGGTQEMWGSLSKELSFGRMISDMPSVLHVFVNMFVYIYIYIYTHYTNKKKHMNIIMVTIMIMIVDNNVAC